LKVQEKEKEILEIVLQIEVPEVGEILEIGLQEIEEILEIVLQEIEEAKDLEILEVLEADLQVETEEDQEIEDLLR
jgi:hypothetical protein